MVGSTKIEIFGDIELTNEIKALIEFGERQFIFSEVAIAAKVDATAMIHVAGSHRHTKLRAPAVGAVPALTQQLQPLVGVVIRRIWVGRVETEGVVGETESIGDDHMIDHAAAKRQWRWTTDRI